jgi:hypothetical protein
MALPPVPLGFGGRGATPPRTLRSGWPPETCFLDLRVIRLPIALDPATLLRVRRYARSKRRQTPPDASALRWRSRLLAVSESMRRSRGAEAGRATPPLHRASLRCEILVHRNAYTGGDELFGLFYKCSEFEFALDIVWQTLTWAA